MHTLGVQWIVFCGFCMCVFCRQVCGCHAQMHPVISQSNEHAVLSQHIRHNTRLLSPPHPLPRRSHFLRNLHFAVSLENKTCKETETWRGNEVACVMWYRQKPLNYIGLLTQKKNMCKHSCNCRHTGRDTNTQNLPHTHTCTVTSAGSAHTLICHSVRYTTIPSLICWHEKVVGDSELVIW